MQWQISRYLLTFLLTIPVYGYSQCAFCSGGYRLGPVNYIFRYPGLEKKIARETQRSDKSFLAFAHEPTANCNESERCLYNRFLFTDFLIYFGLTEKYDKETIQQTGSRLPFMLLRDDLFKRWTKQLKYQDASGFSAGEKDDLRGMSSEDFLASGITRFAFFGSMLDKMNKQPRIIQSARFAAYKLLAARTPFSVIMPFEAWKLIMDPTTKDNAKSILSALESKDCKPLLNAESDSAATLAILGVLSSQRHYLLRDWKGWMEQNHSREEFETLMETIKTTATIYFAMETYAERCGAAALYPSTEIRPELSPKAYHFWSSAYLSYRLAAKGFDRTTAVRESTRPAKKYKRFIQIPGYAYNLFLNTALYTGTTGDVKRVLAEQEQGAAWGFDLFHKLSSATTIQESK